MSDELNSDTPVQTPGPLLRAAREQAGLTTQQVAQRLNLRHSVVVGMEQDEFEPGTSTTYIRGYLRNYARLVGLDEQQLNQALDHLDPRPADHTMQSFSRRTNREKADNRWMMMTWVIALALVGLAVWWWVAKEPERSRVPEATEAQSQEAINPAPAEPVAPQTIESEAQSSQPASAPAEQADPAPSRAPGSDAPRPGDQSTTVAEDTAEPPAAQQGGAEQQTDALANTLDEAQPEPAQPELSADQRTLSISLNGECWMLVQDADGKVLVEGLKRAGFQSTISGKAPLKMRFGAPETVTLALDGEAVDLSSFKPGKVARLTLPKQG